MKENQKQQNKKPVTERIRTMTDVLEELGPDHPLVAQYRHYLETTDPEQRDDYTATFMQLRMVCEALNEGWHASSTPNERRYWPWICLYKDMEEAEKYKLSDEEIVEIPESVRCVLFGGAACLGAFAGLACAFSPAAPPRPRLRPPAPASAIKLTNSRCTPCGTSPNCG